MGILSPELQCGPESGYRELLQYPVIIEITESGCGVNTLPPELLGTSPADTPDLLHGSFLQNLILIPFFKRECPVGAFLGHVVCDLRQRHGSSESHRYRNAAFPADLVAYLGRTCGTGSEERLIDGVGHDFCGLLREKCHDPVGKGGIERVV